MKQNKISNTDLAYAAGIIDGEGCIKICRVPAVRLHRNFDRFQLCVQVDTVKPETVNWLYKKFGGKLYPHKRSHIKHPTWNNSIRWYVFSQQAGIFLKRIYKFLIIKKEHANNAIEFLKLPAKSPQKINCWILSVKLNKTGRMLNAH